MSATDRAIDDISVHFNLRRRQAAARGRLMCSFAIAEGETLGLVGESGSGKIHARQRGRGLAGTDRRHASASAASPWNARRPARGATRHPDRLPGPVQRARSAHAGLRPSSPSRCASSASAAVPSRRARAAELVRRVGLPARRAEPLSARILRRPAPAHRHRPRARPRAAPDRRRRAALRARRLHPEPDPEPDEGTPGEPRPRPICSSATTSPW